MNLIEKLLAKAAPSNAAPAAQAVKILVRVYLDSAGHVTDVAIRKSCGVPELDARAQREIAVMRFPGKSRGAKTSHNWHDLTYTIHQ
ncbi:energy transducer TonB [Collimonas humicola]|uniref:energy transducer TonB n=1 Tax=Collimonas humicola TaxID=2825886 RepID=UPI001B8B7C3F|nr:energy transducer TonB [Collimonas humicola]